MLNLDYLRYLSGSLSWQRVIFLGLSLRLFLFLIICFIPVPYGPSPPISPFSYQTGVDLGVYLGAINSFISLDGLLELANVYYKTLLLGMFPEIRPVGPVYPLLLYFFDYGPQNTLSFSLVVFFLEMSAFTIWCLIEKHRASGLSGLLFAVMPHIIWFGILISTDIFAYFLFSVLFGLIFLGGKFLRTIPFVCLLVILVRPTGIIICLVALFTRSQIFQTRFDEILIKVTVILIMVFGLLFYIPYHLVDQFFIENVEEYRELARTDFLINPLILKFFAIFGFHSSESGLLIAEIVRAFYGIFFVIGFIVIIFTKAIFRIPLVILFGFILIYHIPSWRYLLPFLPLLVLYGGKAVEEYFLKKSN